MLASHGFSFRVSYPTKIKSVCFTIIPHVFHNDYKGRMRNQCRVGVFIYKLCEKHA